MKKNLSVKFLAICVLTLSLLAVGLFLTLRFFRNEVILQQRENLTTDINVVEEFVNKAHFSTNQSLTLEESENIQNFARISHKRVTLLLADGTIFFDNDHGTSKETIGESRQNRPEIKSVLSGNQTAYSLRYSKTLSTDLLYVAKNSNYLEKTLYIIRLSESYSGFSSGVQQFTLLLILFFSLLAIGILVLLYLFTAQKKKNTKDLLPIVETLIAHPEKELFFSNDAIEETELYTKINQLSLEVNRHYRSQASSKTQLASLVDKLDVGIFMVDSAHTLAYANPKFYQLFHVTPENLKSSYLSAFHSPELLQTLEKALDEKKDQRCEVILEYPQTRFLDVTIRFLEVSPEQPIVLLGLAYDLTQIRQLEKMQQDFVGNVSHELKTPVTSLIGFTETLLDGAMEDPELLKSFLEIMQKDAYRLQALIQDILLLSRDRGATGQLGESTDLAFAPLVEDILTSLQIKISSKNLQIENNIPAHFHFVTRPQLLQPVVKNLLENALQYTDNGGKITLTAGITPDQQIFFQVQDSGIGLTDDQQKRIFERFYRVDKARDRHTGGTGLGLAIVAHNLSLLDGSIRVKSHLGIGSTFTITLPHIEK